MKAVEISDAYLVRDSGTSDGSQDKYYQNRIWYKQDYYGGEGYCEYLSSSLLRVSRFDSSKFVSYREVNINGIKGCESDDFLLDGEEFITLYRLYSNVKGGDIASVLQRMDYDDAIEYVLSFVREQTGLDIREYLANTFALDRIIRNTDRHLNNIGVIFDGNTFRTAPIFDNGKSLLVGQNKKFEDFSVAERIKHCQAKAFSPDFDLNYNYLKDASTIKIDWDNLITFLNHEPENLHSNALRYLITKYRYH